MDWKWLWDQSPIITPSCYRSWYKKCDSKTQRDFSIRSESARTRTQNHLEINPTMDANSVRDSSPKLRNLAINDANFKCCIKSCSYAWPRFAERLRNGSCNISVRVCWYWTIINKFIMIELIYTIYWANGLFRLLIGWPIISESLVWNHKKDCKSCWNSFRWDNHKCPWPIKLKSGKNHNHI